jgi:hypothetical protein
MSKEDKLAWLVAVAVFVVSKVFLTNFDRAVIPCNPVICGPDHLPLIGGVVSACLFLIAYASLKKPRCKG